ncbi:hypothetical protein E2C01_064193 [Portunus trituberculatus]|uniref:Uncharacterized protein n=1 Tax=Portunus trituberculatus TaxID=210409 RepID=A0A5B7HCE7_PORTR|nr:hypothetical protein [Portunus trituberculatus]
MGDTGKACARRSSSDARGASKLKGETGIWQQRILKTSVICQDCSDRGALCET